MTRPARALLRWANLRHNYRVARERARHEAYAVIKADGYGHGMVACANALASEADGFAVACVDEAVILREAGIRHPILVLEGAFSAEEWHTASLLHLQLAVHHPQQLVDRANATLKHAVAVWLKLNTGMNRLGIRLAYAPEMIARIRNDNELILRHVMSHYATSDELDSDFYEQQQAAILNHAWPVPLSLSNSAAVLRGAHAQDAVLRPGIMLYGSSPIASISAS
ncbi:MAG: alanine racemase, partial [Oleibacter sp.]|nr:alanine racemase [Thalassolituus sp.]